MLQLLARLIPLRWVVKFGEVRIVIEEFVFSMIAYLNLYKAGFRISKDREGLDDYHRFWWKGDLIGRFPNVVKIGEFWSTSANGHMIPLQKPFITMTEADYLVYIAWNTA